MKLITDSKEFEDLVNKSHEYKFNKKEWSDWGLLFRFLIVICRLLAGNPLQAPLKKKRRPSAWSLFLGRHLKAGKTIQEAAELWKNR